MGTARRSPRLAKVPAVPEFKTWDQYVEEASLPDFELPLGEGEVLRIHALTGGQLFEFEKAMETGLDAPGAIRLLCGEAAEDVLALVTDAPAGAMNALLDAIMGHFGLGRGEG